MTTEVSRIRTSSDYLGINDFIRKQSEEELFKLMGEPRQGYAMPIPAIIELIRSKPYGHPFRVHIRWRATVGCRAKEQDRMSPKGFSGNWHFWDLGKNQHSTRNEYIPESLIKEWLHYKMHHPVKGNQMFGLKASSVARYFSKIRPTLSKQFQKKCPIFKNGLMQDEYELQLKGIRTTFATLYFYKMWKKYNDTSVAMLMTCKKMRHSSTGMTSRYYIENGERINAEYWSKFEIWEIFDVDHQTRLGGE